jgi:hypothetical protein
VHKCRELIAADTGFVLVEERYQSETFKTLNFLRCKIFPLLNLLILDLELTFMLTSIKNFRTLHYHSHCFWEIEINHNAAYYLGVTMKFRYLLYCALFGYVFIVSINACALEFSVFEGWYNILQNFTGPEKLEILLVITIHIKSSD